MKPSDVGSLLALVALTTCGHEAVDPAAGPVESIVVLPTVATVAVGSSVSLSAQVLDAAGLVMTDRSVHWASENTEVATVSGDGLVTAKKVGNVQVAASTGGRSGLAQVTVVSTPVASVSVLPGNKALVVDETFQFTAETRDADGNVLVGRMVAWSSNNEEVATVTATGLVTAHVPGGAIITATAEGKSAPGSVTVKTPSPTSIVVTPAQVLLDEGLTAQLTAQVLDEIGRPMPSNLILFSSSDSTIARVSPSGLVTALRPGKATISATSSGKTGTADLTVAAAAVRSVVVSPPFPAITVGQLVTMTAQAFGSSGQLLSGRSIAWSSSSPAIADVSTSGVVTGVSLGSAVIVASIDSVLGSTNVSVVPVPVATVTVAPSTSSIMVGQTAQLTATLKDAAGNTLTGRRITWATSQASVAAVDSTGVVTGVSAGTATISATSENQVGTATVTVGAGVRTVQVIPDTATIGVLGTVKLTAVVRDPSGAIINTSVSWSSSNNAVARVASDGTVTGLIPGTAIITAKSGSATGTATITVK